jgi:hypothetical protein
MGLIRQILATLFGTNSAAVRELVEVFKVNAEGASQRGHDLDSATLNQFAAEFVARAQRTWWDSLVDGLNRLPRPALTLGVFALLVWTVIDPVFMAEVFTAWAIIPIEVWGLITIVVTFFFGGRQQAKALDAQRDVAGVMARTQMVLNQRASLRDLDAEPPADGPAPLPDDNPALAAILAAR